MDERIFSLDKGSLSVGHEKIIISDNFKVRKKQEYISIGLNLLMCLGFLTGGLRENDFLQILFWGIMLLVWVVILIFFKKESYVSEIQVSNIKSIKIKLEFSYTNYGNELFLVTFYLKGNKIRTVRLENINNQEEEFLKVINYHGIKIMGIIN